MANVDSPSGLRPVNQDGSAWTGGANLYMATSGAAMFIGDPVLITGQSNTVEIEGMGPGCVPIVNSVSTANTDAISGVVVGVVARSADDPPYRPASKVNRLVWVCDDPRALFEAQVDSAVTLTQEDIGNAALTVTTHSGSTVTGRSGVEVGGTIATQGTYRIERLVARPDNELGQHCKVLVSVRKHTKATRGIATTSGYGIGIA